MCSHCLEVEPFIPTLYFFPDLAPHPVIKNTRTSNVIKCNKFLFFIYFPPEFYKYFALFDKYFPKNCASCTRITIIPTAVTSVA